MLPQSGLCNEAHGRYIKILCVPEPRDRSSVHSALVPGRGALGGERGLCDRSCSLRRNSELSLLYIWTGEETLSVRQYDPAPDTESTDTGFWTSRLQTGRNERLLLALVCAVLGQPERVRTAGEHTARPRVGEAAAGWEAPGKAGGGRARATAAASPGRRQASALSLGGPQPRRLSCWVDACRRSCRSEASAVRGETATETCFQTASFARTGPWPRVLAGSGGGPLACTWSARATGPGKAGWTRTARPPPPALPPDTTPTRSPPVLTSTP